VNTIHILVILQEIYKIDYLSVDLNKIISLFCFLSLDNNNNLLLDDNVITVAICLEFKSRHESSDTILNENDDDEERSFCLVM
jgi:hypothetical protein